MAAYLLLSGLPAAFALAALHLLLLFAGAVAAERRIGSRQPVADGERLFMIGLLFLLAGFSLSFLLLALRAQTRTALLCGSGLWCALMIALEPSAIAWRCRDLVQPFREPRSVALALAACTAAVFACCGLVLFLPHSMFGDVEKAYLAVAKYFALSNRLVLDDPVYLWDEQVRAFAQTQEVVLSAGYLLAKDPGAKLVAWSIVAVELAGTYAVCRAVGKLSAAWSWFATLAFALCPILFELSATVRPENLLTVAGLAMLYLADGIETDSRRNLPLFACAAGLAIGAKYTGLVLVAAVCCAWAPSLLRAVRRARASTVALSLLALVPGAFWYARNLFLWGTVVSMKPYGTYHLTIHYPPLRSVTDVAAFVARGFLETSRYTEYGDFGYGAWGALFVPSLLWSLRATTALRRLATFAAAYVAVMLSATRQIRYLAPVVPALLLLIAAGLQEVASHARHALRKWTASFAFAAVGLQLWFTAAVNGPREVGWALTELTAGRRLPGSPPLEPYRTLNGHLRPDDVVMTSFGSDNYASEAKQFRGDPLNSFADLLARQGVFEPNYWLDSDNLAGIKGASYFNDPAFLASVTETVASAGMYWNPAILAHLRRPLPLALTRLRDAIVAQGWDLAATQLASAEFKRLSPLDVVLGAPLRAGGIDRQLYRFESDWDEAYLGAGEPFSVLARHFDEPLPAGPIPKPHAPVLEARDPVIAVHREGLSRDGESLSWKAEADGARISYLIERTWPQDGALVEVYVQGSIDSDDSIVAAMGEPGAERSFAISGVDCRWWCFGGAWRMDQRAWLTLRLNPGGSTAVRNVCLVFRRPSALDPAASWLPLGLRLEQRGIAAAPQLRGAVAYLHDAVWVRGLETDAATVGEVTTERVRFDRLAGRWSRVPEATGAEGRVHYTMRLSDTIRGRALTAQIFLRGRVYDRDASMLVAAKAGSRRFELRAPIFENLAASSVPWFGSFDVPADAKEILLDVSMMGRPFGSRVMLSELLLVLAAK